MSTESTSTHHALESGIYQIFTHIDKRPVGRRLAEDFSLLPKPVFALHEGSKGVTKWIIHKTETGKYTLKIGGEPVGPWSPSSPVQHLYAFLKNGPFDGAVEWDIEHVNVLGGGKGYIIVFKIDDKWLGWSAYNPDGPNGNQIAVTGLPVALSLPPQYFPSDVFQFTRIREAE